MAKKKQKKGDVHELTDMEVQFVSLVPKGANRQERFLMVKTGEHFDVVPAADATQQVKQLARDARAREFGIEVLSKGALTFTEGGPTEIDLYADPVNLQYPLGDGDNKVDKGLLEKGLADLKENHGDYSQDTSKAVVCERIVQKALAEDVDIELDSKDELGSLLPEELVNKIAAKADGDTDDPHDPEDTDTDTDTDSDVENKQAAAADMAAWLDETEEGVDDLLFEHGMLNDGDEPIPGELDDEPEPRAPKVGKGQAPPKRASADAKLQRKIEELKVENAKQRRALASGKDALRKAQLRASKIRKNAIGASSGLVAGEVPDSAFGGSGTGDDQLNTIWASGGDLAGGR